VRDTKRVTSRDLKRIVEAKKLLSDISRDATPDLIAKHTGYDVSTVQTVLADPVFQDLYDMYCREEFALWAGIVADEQEEISKIIARIGYKAAARLDRLIDSKDEKIANSAIRTALEYNADLERPVVRHEITTRSTKEELDKAREVVRRLRPQPEPELPDADRPN